MFDKKRDRYAFHTCPFSLMRSKMVGATGFEPATARTPSVCATMLRYAPNVFCEGFRRRQSSLDCHGDVLTHCCEGAPTTSG